MSDELKAASNPGTGMPGDPRSQPPQFSLDYSNLSTIYTNFCHVTFTPEELILDFGLNTQAVPTPGQPIKLSHRVVINFYTAKRLMNALMFSVSKFENAFGALELDPQKRDNLSTALPFMHHASFGFDDRTSSTEPSRRLTKSVPGRIPPRIK